MELIIARKSFALTATCKSANIKLSSTAFCGLNTSKQFGKIKLIGHLEENQQTKIEGMALDMRELSYQRQFRTSSSEGYLILENDERIGRVDLHFASDKVYATIVLELELDEPEVADIIGDIDEQLVVTASVKRDDLNVWVYQGQEVGFYNDEFMEEDFSEETDEEVEFEDDEEV